MSFPGRILCTTVKTDISGIPLLPVRSNKDVPKDRLLDCMGEISKAQVSGKVKMGEPVIRDILGLGVDIVASRSIPYAFGN